MREHQIIISLKSEQFEELQRMARAAGSKSLSAFARQKLLLALGLSGSGKSRTEGAADAPDLKHLAGELRRLHKEVQVFVAESLVQGDYPLQSAVEAGSTAVPTVRENFLANGAPLMPITDFGRYDISAQPPQTRLMPSRSSVPKYPLSPGRGPLPMPGYPIPPPDPPLKAPQMPLAEPQDPTDQPVSDAKADYQAFAEADDELEELAERAFAISPRLGSLEPQSHGANSFPDPLKDLLEDALLQREEYAAQPEEVNEVETAEELESEASGKSGLPLEEEENLAEASGTESEQEESGEETEEETAPVSADLEQDQADRDEEQLGQQGLDREHSDVEDLNQEDSDQEDSREEQSDDEEPGTSSQDDAPSPPPLRPGPHFSGGPPPRKRPK